MIKRITSKNFLPNVACFNLETRQDVNEWVIDTFRRPGISAHSERIFGLFCLETDLETMLVLRYERDRWCVYVWNVGRVSYDDVEQVLLERLGFVAEPGPEIPTIMAPKFHVGQTVKSKTVHFDGVTYMIDLISWNSRLQVWTYWHCYVGSNNETCIDRRTGFFEHELELAKPMDLSPKNR